MTTNIALYSARKTNKNWGYGNRVYAAIRRLGWTLVFDCDYRKENFRLGQNLPEDTIHLIMKGEQFKPEDIKAIKGKKILWYPDQVSGFPDRQRWVKECGPLFDLLCISHLNEKSFYEQCGKPVKMVSVGYSPEFHQNYNETGHRPIRIGFAGNIDKHRQEYITAFSKAGLPIEVRKVYGEELQKFYSQCQIVWNLGWQASGIQTRFFEAMGAGAMVLTNEIDEESGCPLIMGEHMVGYSDVEDAIAKAREYLKDNKKRRGIAKAGEEAVKKEDLDSRLRFMLASL